MNQGAKMMKEAQYPKIPATSSHFPEQASYGNDFKEWAEKDGEEAFCVCECGVGGGYCFKPEDSDTHRIDRVVFYVKPEKEYKTLREYLEDGSDSCDDWVHEENLEILDKPFTFEYLSEN
jgi:hypothetical protein